MVQATGLTEEEPRVLRRRKSVFISSPFTHTIKIQKYFSTGIHQQNTDTIQESKKKQYQELSKSRIPQLNF